MRYLRSSLSAVVWFSALFGLPQLQCEHYVVQLALDEQRPAERPEEGQAAPPVVNMSIGGVPFHCRLPTASLAGPQRARRAAQHLAAGRAAALVGRCFHGQAGDTGETFELCVGDHVATAGMSAPHEAESDSLLPGGGFEQVYSNIATGGRSLRAVVRCRCQLPGPAPPEPPCRAGDSVEVRPADGQAAAAAAVAADAGEEWLAVRWADASGGAAREGSNGRLVKRSETFSADGRACSAGPPELPAAAHVVSASGGPDTEAASRSFSLELLAAPCCGTRDLRSRGELQAEAVGPDLEFQRLLAPLAGRCMQVLSGWWTYELCWPWRVRQFHTAVNGDIEAPAVVLGRFADGPGTLTERRAAASDAAASRAAGQRRELVTTLEGDACENTIHTWALSLESSPRSGGGGRNGISAVGGSFNPAGCRHMEGTLAHVESNADGCSPFADRLDGAIVLVKRGKCWFHSKALNAQAAGAAAVVVFNDQRQMVDVMEGVDELPQPRIPTVLVEREQGAELQRTLGSRMVLSKVNWDGMDLKRPVSTSVTFQCGAEWGERRDVCQPGDAVDVKLVSKEQVEVEPQFPKTSVRVLKANVVEVFKHNGTMLVSWQLQGLGDEAEAVPPPLVFANASFNGGLRCDADGSAYIERLAEPQACQAEFVVHAAALCAHPRLAPPPPREAQVIACAAGAGARAGPRRRELVAEQRLGEASQ